MKKTLLTITATAALLLTGCGGSSSNGGAGAGFGFTPSLVAASYGVKKVEDPTGSAPTPEVWRFEVRDGDCTSDSSGWNDCDNDRERAELSQKNGRMYNHKEEWYGWHLYLPNDFPTIKPATTYLGQFHQVNGKPIIMFMHNNRGLFLSNLTMLRTALKEGQTFMAADPFNKLLIPDDQLRGRWHYIEVHAKWDKKKMGFYRIYVNGEMKDSWRGVTMDGRRVYFKFGIYRYATDRYRYKYNEPIPTQIAYYTPPTRAKSREKLQKLSN